MVLSSSPTRRRAVRGAMILSEEGRAVKVRGRNPGVLVVTVPFPANEILGFSPEPPVAKNLLYFILDRPSGNWTGGGTRGCGRKNNLVCTDAKEGRERCCGYCGKERAGEIQPECSIVYTFRDSKWDAKFGHKFPGSCIRVG